jgi:glycosyltransferase involved in cell wall biosynthesis
LEGDVKITIITACYNGAETIEDTIRSVASQTYRNIEHIIVDGNSTDNTMEIVARNRDKVSIVVSEPDDGVYHAMNKGLRLASGDVIGFLNSDDVYVDEHVLDKIAAIFRDAEVDACYADLIYVERENPQKLVRYWRSRPFSPGLFKRGWMPAHPTFFVRREIYEKYGGFDLQFRLQSDFDLTMRLLEKHRIRSVYIPTVLVRMRMGGLTNKSVLNVLRGNLEAYRACRKNGLKVTPFFMVRKVLSRLPQFLRK